MLLSSGVIWRHREWDDFRRECPGGDEALQRLVWERLDDALAWLRSLGAPVVREETGNPLTTSGTALRLPGLTTFSSRACQDARCYSRLGAARPRSTPPVLATGGFAASRELVERYISPAAPLRLRASANRGRPATASSMVSHTAPR